MTALSGKSKGSKHSRRLTTFQVDLMYPEAAAAGKVAAGSSGSSAMSPTRPAPGEGVRV